MSDLLASFGLVWFIKRCKSCIKVYIYMWLSLMHNLPQPFPQHDVIFVALLISLVILFRTLIVINGIFVVILLFLQISFKYFISHIVVHQSQVNIYDLQVYIMLYDESKKVQRNHGMATLISFLSLQIGIWNSAVVRFSSKR